MDIMKDQNNLALARHHNYKANCYMKLVAIIYGLNLIGSVGFCFRMIGGIQDALQSLHKDGKNQDITWQPYLVILPFALPCFIYLLVFLNGISFCNKKLNSANFSSFKSKAACCHCTTHCLLWSYMLLAAVFIALSAFATHAGLGQTDDDKKAVLLVAAGLLFLVGFTLIFMNIINIFLYCMLICYYGNVRFAIYFFENGGGFLEGPDLSAYA